MKRLPILKWHQQTQQNFKDMSSAGVANIVSEAVLDNELEAPLSTVVDASNARALHTMFSMYARYATDQHEKWVKLSPKERRALGTAFDNHRTGYLHNLVRAGLSVPAGFTLELSSSTRGSFAEQGQPAYIELVVTLVPVEDMTLLPDVPKKKGRPAKFDQNQIIYKLARTFYTGTGKYSLSVKGSGLFLLQGNKDYALPSKISGKVDTHGMPTELYLFLSTMRAPFTFLRDLAKTAIKLDLGTEDQKEQTKVVPKFIKQLSNADLQVRGFTFTRYIDFSSLFGVNTVSNLVPNSRQLFLKSLFLIYDVAKGNRQDYANNGMKTYRGITADTTFEEESYHKVVDDVSDLEGEGKVYKKLATTTSRIHGVRLTNTQRDVARNASHILTSIYFSLPRTIDRGKLGLDAKGANYLRNNCLRVRFTVFNKFLKDSRIQTLDDLIQHLCKDKQLTTFRTNLDKLFHRVLTGYDYFYWSGLTWRPVAQSRTREAFISSLERDTTVPPKVRQVLDLWLRDSTTDTPALHSLENLIMQVYENKAWLDIREGKPVDKSVLRKTRTRANQMSKMTVKHFGVDIKYPLAFHVTVLEAFRNSTLHALYYSGDPDRAKYTLGRKEELQNLMQVSVAAVKHLADKSTWHALPMTMRKRETELIL